MSRRPRVLEMHLVVRVAFAVAAVFGVISLVWAAVVGVNGGSWWGPIHAFLLGAVLAAISGTSQLFTVTWASAPPPSQALTSSQGALLVIGAVCALIGVTAGIVPLIWLGAVAIVSALLLLALILVRIVHSSLLRRFDLSSRFYLLALASGSIGVAIGAVLASGSVDGDSYARLRVVHLHLNLVGLIGFTIVGTLPTLLPTFAHHRMVSGNEAAVARWICVAAAALMASGVIAPSRVVGAGVLLAAVAAVVVTIGILTRLRGRWSKEALAYIQVTAGVGWLSLWAAVDGVRLITGASSTAYSAWTAAAISSGVGQVLAGSLAYLVPVVVGPPIGANLRRLGRRPAIPVIAANLLGALLIAGRSEFAVVAGIVWAVDFALRLITVRRPGPATTDG